MKINYAETDRLAIELNAAAQTIYSQMVADAPEADRYDQAREACDKAADDAGMVVVQSDKNDTCTTTVLRDEDGNLVNCWNSTPDEHADDDDFSGIGFDANLEWYLDSITPQEA